MISAAPVRYTFFLAYTLTCEAGQWLLNGSAHRERLVESEEPRWVILCLDANQTLVVRTVVGISPPLEIRVDEVLEHPPGSPRMHRCP